MMKVQTFVGKTYEANNILLSLQKKHNFQLEIGALLRPPIVRDFPAGSSSNQAGPSRVALRDLEV